MGLTVGQVIEKIRWRHPLLGEQLVPSRGLAFDLSRYQLRLAQKATQLLPSYLAQVFNIGVELSAANQRTVAGATVGGFPGEVEDGVFSPVDSGIGQAVDFDSELAPIAFGPFAPTSATLTAVHLTGAGWTINEHAARILRIEAGPGEPHEQEIVANDADDLTGLAFTVVPDATTVMSIVEASPAVSGEIGAVTRTPPLGRNQGYLVKIDATGAPYLDLTTPLVCYFDEGVTLPQHLRVLPGARLRSASPNTPLAEDLPASLPEPMQGFNIVPYGQRHFYQGPAGYILGEKLYLIGGRAEWTGVRSIELRLVPIPPPVTETLDDVFLLPDAAEDALASYGVLCAYARLSALLKKEIGPDVIREWTADRKDAEASYLASVLQRKKTQRNRALPRR